MLRGSSRIDDEEISGVGSLCCSTNRFLLSPVSWKARQRRRRGGNLSAVLCFHWVLVRGRFVKGKSAALSYYGEEHAPRSRPC